MDKVSRSAASYEQEIRVLKALVDDKEKRIRHFQDQIGVLTREMDVANDHAFVNARYRSMSEKIVGEQHTALCTLIRVLGEVTPEKVEKRAA